MAGFKMDDYVDVAERIREFSAKYPDGSLQAELVYMVEPAGWFATAHAYRSADDVRPGVGHAFEPVPGKTPYTKDSECMNAETSAWGRAIVALGFDTKKIASQQEVRARQGEQKPKLAAKPADAALVAARDKLQELADRLGAGPATKEAIDRHRGAPDELDWLTRQTVTAEANVAKKAA